MITLRESRYEELTSFILMDKQSHSKDFINPTPLETHQRDFQDNEITYLSIEKNHERLAGYFILVRETGQNSVEFRRIVVDETCVGIGQQAIREMESYCANSFLASRIWLDVYDDNNRGKHIYEKFGYKRFDSKLIGGRQLHFYEKSL